MEDWERATLLGGLLLFIVASLATTKIIPWTSRSLEDWRKPKVLGTVILLMLGASGFVTGVATIFAEEPATEKTVVAMSKITDAMNVKADKLVEGQETIKKAVAAKTPSPAERSAWQARNRSSCSDLRRHISRFPEGAYLSTATALLNTRREEQTGERHTVSQSLPLTEIPDGDLSATPTRARNSALRRAQRQANRLCHLYASGAGELRGAKVTADRWNCIDRACGFEGHVACVVEEPVVREICGGGIAS